MTDKWSRFLRDAMGDVVRPVAPAPMPKYESGGNLRVREGAPGQQNRAYDAHPVLPPITPEQAMLRAGLVQQAVDNYRASQLLPTPTPHSPAMDNAAFVNQVNTALPDVGSSPSVPPGAPVDPLAVPPPGSGFSQQEWDSLTSDEKLQIIAQFAPAPQAPVAPPVGPQTNVNAAVPPGFTVEEWQSLTPQEKAQVRGVEVWELPVSDMEPAVQDATNVFKAIRSGINNKIVDPIADSPVGTVLGYDLTSDIDKIPVVGGVVDKVLHSGPELNDGSDWWTAAKAPIGIVDRMIDAGENVIRNTDLQDIKDAPGDLVDYGRDYGSNVKDAAGRVVDDPGVDSILNLGGQLIKPAFDVLDAPLSQVKDATGEQMYQTALGRGTPKSGQPDPMLQWVVDHPEEWDAIKDVYVHGYDFNQDGHTDFTGSRAVWEYVIGKQDAVSRTLADVAYDPLTAVAPAVGRTGTAIREAEGAGLARRAAGRALESANLPNTVFDEVVGTALKPVGKAISKTAEGVGHIPGVTRLSDYLASPDAKTGFRQQREALDNQIETAVSGVNEVRTNPTDEFVLRESDRVQGVYQDAVDQTNAQLKRQGVATRVGAPTETADVVPNGTSPNGQFTADASVRPAPPRRKERGWSMAASDERYNAAIANGETPNQVDFLAHEHPDVWADIQADPSVKKAVEQFEPRYTSGAGKRSKMDATYAEMAQQATIRNAALARGVSDLPPVRLPSDTYLPRNDRAMITKFAKYLSGEDLSPADVKAVLADPYVAGKTGDVERIRSRFRSEGDVSGRIAERRSSEGLEPVFGTTSQAAAKDAIPYRERAVKNPYVRATMAAADQLPPDAEQRVADGVREWADRTYANYDGLTPFERTVADLEYGGRLRASVLAEGGEVPGFNEIDPGVFEPQNFTKPNGDFDADGAFVAVVMEPNFESTKRLRTEMYQSGYLNQNPPRLTPNADLKADGDGWTVFSDGNAVRTFQSKDDALAFMRSKFRFAKNQYSSTDIPAYVVHEQAYQRYLQMYHLRHQLHADAEDVIRGVDWMPGTEAMPEDAFTAPYKPIKGPRPDKITEQVYFVEDKAGQRVRREDGQLWWSHQKQDAAAYAKRLTDKEELPPAQFQRKVTPDVDTADPNAPLIPELSDLPPILIDQQPIDGRFYIEGVRDLSYDTYKTRAEAEEAVRKWFFNKDNAEDFSNAHEAYRQLPRPERGKLRLYRVSSDARALDINDPVSPIGRWFSRSPTIASGYVHNAKNVWNEAGRERMDPGAIHYLYIDIPREDLSRYRVSRLIDEGMDLDSGNPHGEWLLPPELAAQAKDAPIPQSPMRTFANEVEHNARLDQEIAASEQAAIPEMAAVNGNGRKPSQVERAKAASRNGKSPNGKPKGKTIPPSDAQRRFMANYARALKEEGPLSAEASAYVDEMVAHGAIDDAIAAEWKAELTVPGKPAKGKMAEVPESKTTFIDVVMKHYNDPKNLAEDGISPDLAKVKRSAMSELSRLKDITPPQARGLLGHLFNAMDFMANLAKTALIANPFTGVVLGFRDRFSNYFVGGVLEGRWGVVRNAMNPEVELAFMRHDMGKGALGDIPGMDVVKGWGLTPGRNVVDVTMRDLGDEIGDKTAWHRMFGGVGKKLGGTTGERIGRGLAHGIAPDSVLAWRHAGDQSIRWSLFTTLGDEAMRAERDEFFALIRNTLPPEQADRVIGQLTDMGTFTRADVWNLTKNKELSKDWLDRTAKVNKYANDEVKRVYFSYDQTKLDAGIRKFFIFHYWLSRHSIYHARAVLNNPMLLYRYHQAWDAMDRHGQESGANNPLQYYVTYMSKSGWLQAVLNPAGTIVPVIGILDPDNEKRPGETWFDYITRTLPVFVAPHVQAAAVMLGQSTRYPDMTGLGSVFGNLVNIHNWARNQGLDLPGFREGVTPNLVKSVNDRILNLANEAMTWVSGGKIEDVELPDQVQQQKGVIMDIALDQALEEYGVNSYWDLPTAAQKEVDAAMLAIETGATGNERAARAYETWGNMRGTYELIRVASPIPGYVRSTGRTERNELTSQGYDAKKEGGQPTPEQQAAMDNSQYLTDTPEAREVNTQYHEYLNMGDPEIAALAKAQNEILFPEEGAIPDNYTMTVRGKTFTFGEVRQMTDDQRRFVADAWLEEQGPGAVDAVQKYKDERDAFVAANPELSGYIDYRDQVFKVGPQSFREQVAGGTMPSNPNFARAQEEKRQKLVADGLSGEELEAALDKWATSPDGYFAFYGKRSSRTGKEPIAVNDPTARPVMPSAPGDASGTQGNGSGATTGSKGYDETRDMYQWQIDDEAEILSYYADVDKRLQAAGVSDINALNPDAQKFVLRDMPDKPRSVSSYESWVKKQPEGADTSLPAYWKSVNAEYDKKKNREVETSLGI